MEKEIWKDIQGFEGLYQVSNIGGIKSLSRVCVQRQRTYIKKEQIMRKYFNRQGYLCVRLSKNNIQKGFLVHRLVAQAFIPNPENKQTINHKNGIHFDNRVENLEWATYLENNIHAYENGFRSQESRRKPILQLKNNIVVNRYNSLTEIKKEGKYNTRDIKSVLTGKHKQYRGFTWEYEKKDI